MLILMEVVLNLLAGGVQDLGLLFLIQDRHIAVRSIKVHLDGAG